MRLFSRLSGVSSGPPPDPPDSGLKSLRMVCDAGLHSPHAVRTLRVAQNLRFHTEGAKQRR